MLTRFITCSLSPCGSLSIDELRYAEAQIIKYVQKSAFLPVINALQDVSHGEPEKRTLKNIGSFGSVQIETIHRWRRNVESWR